MDTFHSVQAIHRKMELLFKWLVGQLSGLLELSEDIEFQGRGHAVRRSAEFSRNDFDVIGNLGELAGDRTPG